MDRAEWISVVCQPANADGGCVGGGGGGDSVGGGTGWRGGEQAL